MRLEGPTPMNSIQIEMRSCGVPAASPNLHAAVVLEEERSAWAS